MVWEWSLIQQWIRMHLPIADRLQYWCCELSRATVELINACSVWDPNLHQFISSQPKKIAKMVQKWMNPHRQQLCDDGRLIPVWWATNSNLEFVGFVVMIVQGFEHVAIAGDAEISWVGDALGECLAGVLFNLKSQVRQIVQCYMCIIASNGNYHVNEPGCRRILWSSRTTWSVAML